MRVSNHINESLGSSGNSSIKLGLLEDQNLCFWRKIAVFLVSPPGPPLFRDKTFLYTIFFETFRIFVNLGNLYPISLKKNSFTNSFVRKKGSIRRTCPKIAVFGPEMRFLVLPF